MGPRSRGSRPATPLRRARSAEHRLRHLHLGLDRHAEGRRGHASRAVGESWHAAHDRSARIGSSRGRCSSRPCASTLSVFEISAAAASAVRRWFCPGRSAADPDLVAADRRAAGDALRSLPFLRPAGEPARRGAVPLETLVVCLAARRCPAELAAVAGRMGRRVDQRLRPDRDDHVCDGHDAIRMAMRRQSADRASDLEHAGVRAGRGLEPVPVGGGGRALHRGRGSGARLSGPSRADGGAVRGRPVRSGGEPDVPDRGPGALAARTGCWSSWAGPTIR